MRLFMYVDRDICKECGGFCCNCRMIGVERSPVSKNTLEYWDAKSQEYFDHGKLRIYVVSEPCKHYKDGECSIYDDRPVKCKLFPFDLKDATERYIWKRKCALYERHMAQMVTMDNK